MKRIIMTMFCVAVLLIGSTVSASAMFVPDPVAAFVKDSVSLEGTGVVTGDVYVSGIFSATDASNLMSGKIYKGPNATVSFVDTSEFTGTTIDVEEADFPDTLPSFAADTSGIPKYSPQNYVVGWGTNPNLTTSWAFNKLTISSTLTIDTSAGDVILTANSLEGEGTINIIGDNSVAIVVKNSISGKLRTESSVTQDNLYLFIENGNYTSPTWGNLAATIVMGTGTFNVGGSVAFNGIVISSGTGTFTATGGTTLNAQYYTPNADVQLTNGTTFNGMIEAETLLVSGGSDLNYAYGYVYLPTSFFGESATDPSMMRPDEITVTDDHVSGLKAEYYDTISMTNNSAKRMETQVDSPDFNYQFGTPDSVIDPESFSILYTGYIKPTESGSYTFYTFSDDGVKLTVNGTAIVDRLEDMSLQFTEGTPISLTADTYFPIEISYYENSQNATLFLFYEKDGGNLMSVPASWYYSDATTATQYFNLIDANGNGLDINYYNTKTGALTGGTADATATGDVDMYIRGDAPIDGINSNEFSILFEGYIEPRYTEELTLDFLVDDGIKVYIDDVLLIDQWSDHSEGAYDLTFDAVNGTKYKIKIEYYENYGHAMCCMFWSSDLIPREIVPLEYLYNTL